MAFCFCGSLRSFLHICPPPHHEILNLMSNNPRNAGWASSQQNATLFRSTTTASTGATPRYPASQQYRPSAGGQDYRQAIARSEDAQPNLDEGKNLRPAGYVIGRKEPEPAPPEVLASTSVRSGAGSRRGDSGRSQAAPRGSNNAARPVNGSSNLQDPAGPKASTTSIARSDGRQPSSWPQRGQRSNYELSSAPSSGYGRDENRGKL